MTDRGAITNGPDILAGLQIRGKPQAHPAGSRGVAGCGVFGLRDGGGSLRSRRRSGAKGHAADSCRAEAAGQGGERYRQAATCSMTRCRGPGRAQNSRREGPGDYSIAWASWTPCASSSAGRRFACMDCEGEIIGQAQKGGSRTSDLRHRAGRYAGRFALARMDEPHRGGAVRGAETSGTRGFGARC
jgi:hypothetical protein